MNTELDYLERIAKALERIANVVDKFNETTIKPKNDLPKVNVSTNHSDAWVLVPYDVCITTFPAQYSTTIYHYHDPDGLNVDAMRRGNNTKIFFTKDEAVNYCKTSLGCEYQIVDIPYAEKIVIGDDYE